MIQEDVPQKFGLLVGKTGYRLDCLYAHEANRTRALTNIGWASVRE